MIKDNDSGVYIMRARKGEPFITKFEDNWADEMDVFGFHRFDNYSEYQSELIECFMDNYLDGFDTETVAKYLGLPEDIDFEEICVYLKDNDFPMRAKASTESFQTQHNSLFPFLDDSNFIDYPYTEYDDFILAAIYAAGRETDWRNIDGELYVGTNEWMDYDAGQFLELFHNPEIVVAGAEECDTFCDLIGMRSCCGTTII